MGRVGNSVNYSTRSHKDHLQILYEKKKEITDEYGELVRGAFPGAKPDGDTVNDLKWHKWKFQVDNTGSNSLSFDPRKY